MTTRDSRFATVAALAFAVAAIALARTTFHNGHDFEVIWRTVGNWMRGEDPYSLAYERGMVFKYPPWTLLFLSPLGLLPLVWAKIAWGALQAASLAATGLWLRRRARAGWGTILFTGIAFWGLWAVHALDGQIALPMLAAALWLWRPGELAPGARAITLVWVLSIKVFTVLPLFFYKMKRGFWATLGNAGFFFALLSWPILTRLEGWIRAGSSGGALLGEGHVRGAFNPSFTATLLSYGHVPADLPAADVLLASFLAIGFAGAWMRLSRGLAPEERWVGWLALVPAIHPLPWWHLFVFAFPLATLSVDRAFAAPRRLSQVLAVVGVFLIAAGTRKFLGVFGLSPLGSLLEEAAGKSFGIVACAFSLKNSKS